MPQYPKNRLARSILQNCIEYHIKNVVISPGSRNAALTIGFVNHPDIDAMSIVDERCAAFFALGMAQQSRKPTAVVCTSGSALLNYYPAVAEAFYSNIPLIIISADRPKHLIDIGDGQTIRQENVFKNHILFEANLNIKNTIEVDSTNDKLIIQAIQIAIDKKGPVHINVPFEEPLYETINESDFRISLIKKSSDNTIKEDSSLKIEDFTKYAHYWNSSSKKMILLGSNFPDEVLQKYLNRLVLDESVIVLTETTSNVYHKNFINSIDKVIFSLDDVDFDILKPDILLTLGGMIVSKKVKQFLREYQPNHHWHVDSQRAFDTFHCLSRHFKVTPRVFFDHFFMSGLMKNRKDSMGNNHSYRQNWLILKDDRNKKHTECLSKIEFSDLLVFSSIYNYLPNNIHLQLANSSIIRYSQLFDLDKSLRVFCNRGTSGIEGSTSTAIGAAFKWNGQTLLITGDVSFLYDSNALWNNYIKNDFRVILINNSGGGIFRFIPGPKSTNALEYFETPHNLNVSLLCQMYGFDYFTARNNEEVINELNSFYNDSEQPKLLEIFTPNSKNDIVLKEYFKNF